MKALRKWWRGRRHQAETDAPAPEADPADTPWTLASGSSIVTAFTAPEGARAQALEVGQARSLDRPGARGGTRREIVLEGRDEARLRGWEEESGRLGIARELERGEVEATFGAEAIAGLLNDDETVLERAGEPREMEGWTAPLYRREACEEATEHDGAHHAEMDFYRLVGDERAHAIEIRVFDGGRTEIWAVCMEAADWVEEVYAKSET